jgi:hypothetical protein
LDPEKLETELTNAYNQSINNGVKDVTMVYIEYNKHTRENTKDKVVRLSLLYREIND